MKSSKISALFTAFIIFFGLSLPASATVIKEDFLFPVYAKYEDTEFKFAIELQSSSEYLAHAWFFEIGLREGSMQKTEIMAGDSVKVTEDIKYDKKTGAVKSKKVEINIEPVLFKGDFISFEIEQNKDNKEQLDFLGKFEYSVLDNSDAELLYLYGNFVALDKEVLKPFSASISNFDPTQPGNPSNPVPEPATLFLVGSGMICITAVRRKRKE